MPSRYPGHRHIALTVQKTSEVLKRDGNEYPIRLGSYQQMRRGPVKVLRTPIPTFSFLSLKAT
jgi:hypothetical protein